MTPYKNMSGKCPKRERMHKEYTGILTNRPLINSYGNETMVPQLKE